MEGRISQLYNKDTYLNKNIDSIINKKIIEYDLKSANTSLCKEYNLLSDSVIKKIEAMKKHDRVVSIGKLQRKDKDFNVNLKNSFRDIRKRFFEANSIKDNDILSIKKDAIFCLKECKCTKFGECKFAEKNIYTSYIFLNEKLEIYYNARGKTFDQPKLDIKGIDDAILMRHDGFMLEFFKTLFKHIESGSEPMIFRYLNRFMSQYKHLQLPVGYYREFNNRSMIVLNDMDEIFEDETFIPFEHKQEHLNIDYNFFHVLLPLVKILLN